MAHRADPLPLRNRGYGKPRKLIYYTSQFPEKLLVGRIDTTEADAIASDTVQVWNVGIVNGAAWGEAKLDMLETVYGRIHLETAKAETPVVLGGDINAPKRETADGAIVPHDGPAAYTAYLFYGDPHYLRLEEDPVPYRFDHRWQLAEARIFDPAVGEWGMRDAYWAAAESRGAASTEDHTHVVHAASPSHKRLDHILHSEGFEVRRCEIWNGVGGSIDGFGGQRPRAGGCNARAASALRRVDQRTFPSPISQCAFTHGITTAHDFQNMEGPNRVSAPLYSVWPNRRSSTSSKVSRHHSAWRFSEINNRSREW